MYRKMICFAAVLVAAGVVSGSVSAETRTTYPQVRVQLAETYTPDAAFEQFRKEFINAVTKKDANAIFALVAPGFVWTQNNALATGYDPGRDAQHNFRVVFGFRQAGQDTDGNVEGGPFWDSMAAFANDSTYFQITDSDNLVCSPMAGSVADEEVFERARDRVETVYEGIEWYFSLRATPLAKAPDDKGTPSGKVGIEAFPILQSHPENSATPTHYEILLPSGRTGWIPAAAARPLSTDRLCYAKTAKGEWRIAIFDSMEDAESESSE
jgi:hypothetical protein